MLSNSNQTESAPTFHVLIATVGRPSLQRMLNSLLPQLQCDDHLTLVFDGKESVPEFDLSQALCHVHQHVEPVALKHWGHGIRNKYAYRLEKTDFIMHADDDDVYLPGAFESLRSLCIDRDTLYIARMMNQTSLCPYNDDDDIGTPCGVIPYALNSKARWEYKYGGDGAFYRALKLQAKRVEHLRDFVIYQVFQKKSKFRRFLFYATLIVLVCLASAVLYKLS